MHSKASYMALGVATGVVGLVCPPLAVFALIFVGIKGQKMAMEDRAEEVSNHMGSSDSTILEAVEIYRPEVSNTRITHTFPLKNDALFPIFQTGVSKTTYDLVTGKPKKKIDVTF